MAEEYGKATSYNAYVDGVATKFLKFAALILLLLTALGWVIGFVHITLPSISFGFL